MFSARLDAPVSSQNGAGCGNPAAHSLVDENWERIDPNPDPRALFLSFNERFFQGKLAACEVRWSPRMTLCAGMCVYEGRGGLCSIRLSQPLLKFRPRSDLVETLLAGTNITVYHSFHDEVRHYKTHVWRCDGVCRSKPPYFGYVKRAMNRPPGPNDFWHMEHKNSCGGTFHKISEPDDYGKKGKKPRPDSKTASAGASVSSVASKKNAAGSRSDGKSKPALKRPNPASDRGQCKVDEFFSGTNAVLGSNKDKPGEKSQQNATAVDLTTESDDESTVCCPACQRKIPESHVNIHLDTECDSFSA